MIWYYMVVFTKVIRIESAGEDDIVDLSSVARQVLKESKAKDGILIVFVSGSTAAITTTEFEPGLRKDIPAMLARIAPRQIDYEHNNTWHDGNGRSHVKASLIGPSFVVPFADSNLLLGEWQQIVLLELDTRPRRRQIVMQVMGE
jgi:secondary thiamine-phosphate synthase enzyme